MEYEKILKMKQECFDLISSQLGEEYLSVFKYYKGDLLPFINTKIRKNMTCGDLDSVQWDFYKGIFRIIECKRTGERNKESQDRLLEFLSKIEVSGYRFDVYKIVGDPPYTSCWIQNMKTKEVKEFAQDELTKWLNME